MMCVNPINQSVYEDNVISIFSMFTAPPTICCDYVNFRKRKEKPPLTNAGARIKKGFEGILHAI